MKLLLDTSVIIDYLRSKDKEVSLMEKLADDEHDLCISLLTHTELYSGKGIWSKRAEKEAVEQICSGLTIYNYTVKESLIAGKLRALYNQELIDCIIAATAINHNVALVTLNQKDFVKIDTLRLYTRDQ